MNEQASRESLKQLIAEGKEGKALKKMIAMSDGQTPDIQKLIVLQSNRFEKLKKKRLSGTIDQASANVIASQISSDLFEILDAFYFPGDEALDKSMDTPGGERKKEKVSFRPKVLSSLGGWLLVSSIVLALSIVAYKLGFFNQVKEPPKVHTTPFIKDDWRGTWETFFESDNQIELKGILVISSGQGRFEVKDQESSSFGMTLNQFTFEKGNQVIRGTWEMDEEITGRVPGTFLFKMEKDKKSFQGSYSMESSQKEKFSWRGNKLDP